MWHRGQAIQPPEELELTLSRQSSYISCLDLLLSVWHALPSLPRAMNGLAFSSLLAPTASRGSLVGSRRHGLTLCDELLGWTLPSMCR